MDFYVFLLFSHDTFRNCHRLRELDYAILISIHLTTTLSGVKKYYSIVSWALLFWQHLFNRKFEDRLHLFSFNFQEPVTGSFL